MGGGPNRFALVVGVVWIALIGTASPPACAGPPPQDEAAFTDYVAQAFAHTAPSTHVAVVSPLTLSVDTAGGGQSMLYLNSLYSECRRDPDRCDGLVATWIDQMGAATSDKAAPLDRTMLRAVLRRRLWSTKSGARITTSRSRRRSSPVCGRSASSTGPRPSSIRHGRNSRRCIFRAKSCWRSARRIRSRICARSQRWRTACHRAPSA